MYVDVIDDHSRRLNYRPLDELPKRIVNDKRRIIHHGQRKLLISEIDFLTDYAGTKKCLVIYAGAASGSHISVLLKLFPNVYDTNQFSSTLFNKINNRPRDRVIMYREYLTKDVAKSRYEPSMRNVLFISDIRTNSSDSVTLSDGSVSHSKVSDCDVIRDNCLNSELVSIIQPDACLLKFRLPYRDGSTELPSGQLRLQCWCGVESTEVRLVAERPYTIKQYNHRMHEEAMYYHNLIRPYTISGVRVSQHLLTSLKKIKKHVYYDAYRETSVIDKYVATKCVSESYVYSCINDNMTFTTHMKK